MSGIYKIYKIWKTRFLSCFPDFWKVVSVFPLFKNVWERYTAKNYCALSLLSVVSRILEKLASDKLTDDLEKCGLVSDIHYGFSSSCSTADLLTVVSNRITRVLNRSGATQAITLDRFKAFNRHAGLQGGK